MRFANFMAATALAACAAHAQIRLPLTLPTAPLPSVTQSLDAAGPRALDTVNDWRHQQISRLVRDNKRLIETDPNGEPIVRGEIIAAGNER